MTWKLERVVMVSGRFCTALVMLVLEVAEWVRVN